MKSILISLVIGGAATSAAEYFLHYNLVDFVKDKVTAGVKFIVGKLKAI